MTAQSLTMSLAGLFVLISLGLAHAFGQADLARPSWLWFTVFVGLNLFQAGLTGFCPLTKILKRLGLPDAGGPRA
ncbi:MAG TPA: DUF2892 domain-containing protein [Thermopetrobacter sp.]|nr:DUF2892 domain-containing protein [Thermopetrobacter sp.]